MVRGKSANVREDNREAVLATQLIRQSNNGLIDIFAITPRLGAQPASCLCIITLASRR